MTNQFKMSNRELVSYFLGIEVAQTSEGIIISKIGKKKKKKNRKVWDILKWFEVYSCKLILISI